MDLAGTFSDLSNQVSSFFTFVIGKLSHFGSLTLEEKIGYICVIAGLVLILVSLVLFII